MTKKLKTKKSVSKKTSKGAPRRPRPIKAEAASRPKAKVVRRRRKNVQVVPPSVQTQIGLRIDAFVEEIAQLARRQALETITRTLGAPSPHGSNGANGHAARSKGEKRPAAEIAAMVGQLASQIASAPGQRIEEIGRSLEISTRDLMLPMKKLVAAGKIRTEGERRATRYFVGPG